MVHQVGLQLVVHDNGDILMIRTHYLSFFLFVSILVKIFASSQKKIIWFGLVGSLLVHKGFSIAGRVANYAEVFVKIKTVCLHVVLQEMYSYSFSIRLAKYFYDKPFLNTLIQKLSLFIVCTLNNWFKYVIIEITPSLKLKYYPKQVPCSTRGLGSNVGKLA